MNSSEGAEPSGSLRAAKMIRGAVISYLGFIGVFVSSVIVSRVLGVEGKGVYSLWMATLTGLWIVAALGIAQGHLYHASKDARWLPHFLPNGTAFALGIGGLVGLSYFLGGRALDLDAVALFPWPVLLAGIAAVPAGVLLTYQQQYFLVLERYELAKASVVISLVVLPLLGFIGLALAGRATVSSFAVIFAVSLILSFVVFRTVAYGLGPPSAGFSGTLARRSLTFGWRQFASDVALYLMGRLDFFLVMLFLGARNLGIYSVAVGLAEISVRLSNEIGTMLFPAFAGGSLQAGRPATALRLVTLFACGIALLLALVSTPLVRILFGDAFAAAAPAFLWLLPGTIAWSTTYVTWSYIAAAGRPELGVVVFGTAAAVDAALNVLLLPRLGVVGASIAATASYIVAALLFLHFFRKSERCSLREALIATPADLGLLWGAARQAYGTLRTSARPLSSRIPPEPT
jgi:O-antigen/teichoic acid export membrane protein